MLKSEALNIISEFQENKELPYWRDPYCGFSRIVFHDGGNNHQGRNL